MDSNGSFGREGSPIWWNRASSEEIATYFSKKCATFGFEYGTSEMRDCVMVSAQNSRNRADKTEDAFISSLQNNNF